MSNGSPIVGLIARYPATLALVASEVAMALASQGVPPTIVWRVLLAPAYVAHLVLGPLLGFNGLMILAVLLLLSLALDWGWRRLRAGGRRGREAS